MGGGVSGLDLSVLCQRPLLLYKSVARLIRNCSVAVMQTVACVPFRNERIGLEAVQNIATLHASNLANVCTARRAGGLSVWSVAPIQNAPAAERVVATIDSGIGLVPEADDAEFRLL